MTRGAKVAVVLVAIVATGIAAAATTAAVATYRAGVLRISVTEKKQGGVSFSVDVPMILVRAGMAFVPSDAWRDAREQAAPYASLIEAAAEALMRAPDGPYVQVDGSEEKVRIAKEDGSLVIDVDSPRESVHVSVPLRTFRYAAQLLAARAGSTAISPSPDARPSGLQPRFPAARGLASRPVSPAA